MNEYKLLSSLQKLDIEIDEFSERLANLPEQNQFEKLKGNLKNLERLLKEKQDSLVLERSKQKKIEGELEILDLKIKKEDDKLYSGTVTNPKELKSIQEEVNLLKTQKDAMETELLELLDEVDNMNSEAGKFSSKVGDMTKEVEQAEKEYKKVTEEIEEKLQNLKTERENIELKISPFLISLYEEIRKQKKEAVVEIRDGICQGCFVELPAEEVDKMLQSDKLWRCPQCRRILIR
jgi:predicted  nucleic acid-binding Zn-ribbon protein